MRKFEPDGERAGMVAFSEDGKRLLWAGERAVWLSEVATGKKLASFTSDKNGIPFHIGLTADGKTVAALFSGEDAVLLYDPSGKVRHRLSHPRVCHAFRLSADGKLVVTQGSKEMRVWDATTGKELRQLRFGEPSNWTTVVRFTLSPDGKTVAVGVDDKLGSVRLCDTSTGAEVRRLAAEDNEDRRIRGLAFSPDGKYLATDGWAEGFVIRLWEVATGRLVRQFRLHPPKPVDKEADPFKEREYRYGSCVSYSLAFSPDGKTLVNASDEIHLWEVATGRLRLRVRSASSRVAFSPDGRLLAANTDGGPTVWDWRDLCLKRPARLDPIAFAQSWEDLASEDAALGYRALVSLLPWPKEAVEVLDGKLQPVQAVKPGELAQLFVDLVTVP